MPFKKGDKKPEGSGRKKGTPYTITPGRVIAQITLPQRRQIAGALVQSFQELGTVDYLKWLALEHPKTYAALLAHAMPQQREDTAVGPPRDRDFQRQYPRKPARCQRTRVSGRMIAMVLRTDGNHRYSWTKNKRSPLINTDEAFGTHNPSHSGFRAIQKIGTIQASSGIIRGIPVQNRRS
jgi:hypothetical protein